MLPGMETGEHPAHHHEAPAGHDNHLRGWLLLGAVAWLLSLAATWWLAAHFAVPAPMPAAANAPAVPVDAGADATELRKLRQQVATLRRSDQISRNANAGLQQTLAEREEEVSGLRADVDFYERLVGSTGQRQGLRVHEAKFEPEAGGTWHYTVTLTQNLNRGAISKGGMRFSVEGVRAGKLERVKWDDLLQKPNAPAKAFSFRYFQQLEDSIMLPPGFTPQRVKVSLSDGQEQDFPWQVGR
jgi:hypothetical protein